MNTSLANQYHIEATLEQLSQSNLSKTDIQIRLGQLAKSFKTPPLELDEHHCAMLKLDDELTLGLLYVEPAVGVYMTATIVPTHECSAELLHSLLIANTDWNLSYGGFFSIDDSGTQVVYSQFLNLVEPCRVVTEYVNNFAAIVTTWREEIELKIDLAELVYEGS